MHRVVLRAMLVALALLSALAPTGAFADRRVALIIANSAYDGIPLANPSTDLKLVRPALEKMGFAVTAVENADFTTFDQAVTEFSRTAKGADIALFYFAGHGFAVAGDGGQPENYLMSTSVHLSPTTSELALRRDGISLDHIIGSLTGQAKVTLVFVDACRNDPSRAIGVGGAGQTRSLAVLTVPTSSDIFVGLSTRPGQVALDGVAGQGSPFARAFAEKMVLPGVSVPTAFNEVRKAVQAETANNQRPEPVRSDLDAPDSLVLVAATPPATPLDRTGGQASVPNPATTAIPNPGPAAPGPAATGPAATGPARDDWMLVRDSTNVAALQAYADTYPDTLYAKFALARIEELKASSTPIQQQPVPETPVPVTTVPESPVPDAAPVIADTPNPEPTPQLPDILSKSPASIDFGDDTSRWANNGECDDPRFSGRAVAGNNLETDRGHDATDCRTAVDGGTATFGPVEAVNGLEFGDDASQYANDGECDDPDFSGPGEAAQTLDDDRGHDATDCRTAYDAGTVSHNPA